MTQAERDEIKALVLSFSTRISDLPEVVSLVDGDYITVVQQEGSKKISKKATIQSLLNLIKIHYPDNNGAKYIGVAHPEDNNVILPVGTDGFWFAINPGTYTHYGNTVVEKTPKIILYNVVTGEWSSEELWGSIAGTVRLPVKRDDESHAVSYYIPVGKDTTYLIEFNLTPSTAVGGITLYEYNSSNEVIGSKEVTSNPYTYGVTGGWDSLEQNVTHIGFVFDESVSNPIDVDKSYISITAPIDRLVEDLYRYYAMLIDAEDEKIRLLNDRVDTLAGELGRVEEGLDELDSKIITTAQQLSNEFNIGINNAENRITNAYSSAIEQATSNIYSEVDSRLYTVQNNITQQYTQAIGSAVQQLEESIQDSERSVKNWVTEQGYVKVQALNDYYTKIEVDALIGSISSFSYEIYPSLSSVTDPKSNILYLIGPTGTGTDKYEEYVYSNKAWTKIGDTSIDLSGYVQNADLLPLTEALAANDLRIRSFEDWLLNPTFDTLSVYSLDAAEISLAGDMLGDYLTGLSDDISAEAQARSDADDTINGAITALASRTTTLEGYFTGGSAKSAQTAARLSGDTSYTAWGQTYWNNGVPGSISGDMTSVGSISMNGAISGATTISASGQASVGSLKLVSGAPTLTWDSANSAWHLSGNFYADGSISAGGAPCINLEVMWSSLTNSTSDPYANYKIAAVHIPDMASTYGYATQTWVGQQEYLTSASLTGYVNDLTDSGSGNYVASLSKSGSTLTATYGTLPTSLPASDVYAWAKANNKPSYTFFELTEHPTTLSGYGITDAKIVNGVITLGNDTITPLITHQSLDGYVNALTRIPTSGGNYVSSITKSGKTLTVTYETLPTSLPASDVYAWAKNLTLDESDVPTLAISKISGLQTALDSKLGIESELPLTENITSNEKRITSLEEWFANPVFDEVLVRSLGADEIETTTLLVDTLSASSITVNGTDLSTKIDGYALKTITITGTGYLTGGGNLSANRTIDIVTEYKTQIGNGNTAYGWGNHASAGYLTTTTAASTYETVENACLSELLLAEGISSNDKRITSIEHWMDNAALNELSVYSLNAIEISLSGINLMKLLEEYEARIATLEQA